MKNPAIEQCSYVVTPHRGAKVFGEVLAFVLSLIIVVSTCDARRRRQPRHAPAPAIPLGITPFEVSQQVEKRIAGLERRIESALAATAKDPGLPAVDRLNGELVKCRDEAKGNKGIESQIDVAIASLDKMLKESGVGEENLADLSVEATRIRKTLQDLKSSLTALGTRLEQLNKQTDEWKKIYKLQVAMGGQKGAGEKIKVAAETESERWREKMMYAKPSPQTTQNESPSQSPSPRELTRNTPVSPTNSSKAQELMSSLPTIAPANETRQVIDTALLSQFFDRMWKHNYSNNPDEWASDFAETSSYCYNEYGLSSRAMIASDRRILVERWPSRTYQLMRTPRYTFNAASSEAYVEYRFRYNYYGPGKSAQGISNVAIRIAQINGTLCITQFKEIVERH